MSLENWLKVCRLDFHLLNNSFPYVNSICLSQSWAMPPQNQRSSRNGSFHQKAQKDGRKPHTTSQKSFKGKNKREVCQNKRQQPSETPASDTQKRNDNEPIPGSLVYRENSILKDNAMGIKALYKQWKEEDKDSLLRDNKLMARQRQWCKQVGSVIFGFTFQEAQIDVVWTLFYKRRDLLLLAKTGFGKNLIFQL